MGCSNAADKSCAAGEVLHSSLAARRDIRMHLPGRKIAPDKTVLLFQSCGHKAAALQEHSAEADPRL